MLLKTDSLPPFILKIIRDKSTEVPFSGEYCNNLEQAGTYLCRQCGLALFRSEAQFHSGCGWPAFDNAMIGAIREQPDQDGMRDEIICNRCHAHLGHVFRGEGLTQNNIRHCVNSLALDFVTDTLVKDTEEGIFAAGCFWGVEYYFKKLAGVLKTEVGYIGGQKEHPTYEEICRGNTGHVEALRVIYDPSRISYEQLAKYFFEIHNPVQRDGQGADIGEQYHSQIFYYDSSQQKIAQALAAILVEKKGLAIATDILPMRVFWRAETYHQDYYTKHQQTPYCHCYERRFD